MIESLIQLITVQLLDSSKVIGVLLSVCLKRPSKRGMTLWALLAAARRLFTPRTLLEKAELQKIKQSSA